jgi:predicted phosphodiesterase
MRIAIFSDTHGNSIALDAVLADVAAAGGVDATWFLGDAAPIGFDPVGTVQRLRRRRGLVAVHGNGDRRVATDAAVVQEVSERVIATASPGEAAIWRSVLHDSEWVRDGLRAAGAWEWLASLPLERRETLPDGTRVLLVHAAPGTDEGPGIQPGFSDDEVRRVVAGAEADLVLVGHTHQAIDRVVDGVRVVNPGSVSNPPDGGAEAHWVLLEADSMGYTLVRRAVTWDVRAMLARLAASGHPDPSHIVAFWSGHHAQAGT